MEEDKKNPFSEHGRRRRLENSSREFLAENQERWARLPEHLVVKSLRLWCIVNGATQDLHIFVSPTSHFRYQLVPSWALQRWTRDNLNVYRIPMEPDEHETGP